MKEEARAEQPKYLLKGRTGIPIPDKLINHVKRIGIDKLDKFNLFHFIFFVFDYWTV